MDGEFPHGLRTAHEQVREEITKADGKATTLLSLVGAALAGVIALAARPMPAAALALLWVSALPIGASVVLLLLAIRPRLNRTPPPGTWLFAALVGPATLLESYENGEAPRDTAQDVCVLARIARGKYVRIRCAVTMLIAGLSVLAGSLMLSAVTP